MVLFSPPRRAAEHPRAILPQLEQDAQGDSSRLPLIRASLVRRLHSMHIVFSVTNQSYFTSYGSQKITGMYPAVYAKQIFFFYFSWKNK